MDEITNEFLRAKDFLFSEIDGDKFGQVVCIEHLRFVPCRPCLYSEVALIPYSSKPEDVEIVKDYQGRYSLIKPDP